MSKELYIWGPADWFEEWWFWVFFPVTFPVAGFLACVEFLFMAFGVSDYDFV